MASRSKRRWPNPGELPAGDPIQLVYDFPAVPALATDQRSLSVPPGDVVIYGITGRSSNAAGLDSFRMIAYHSHQDQQRQLQNKSLPARLIAGTGKRIGLLRETLLVGTGDVLTVEVNNIAKAGGVYVAADIQVVLWGVIPA